MASQLHESSASKNVALRFPRASTGETGQRVFSAGSHQVTALNVEFVAKPQEAHRAQSAIPPALKGALGDVSGFAGCLVMISEQEARLITVITLWVGNDRLKQCRDHVRWIHKLLAPYVDRCLRVQTLAAHLPELPGMGIEMDLEREYSNQAVLDPEDETACVA